MPRSTTGAAELDRGERPLVSMEGWARFEQRARQRRIERRLEAARTAIRAGRFADARAALDEIQELDPSHPQIQALSVQIAQPIKPRSRRGAFVAAAMAFVTVLLAASWIRNSGLSPSPSTVVTAAVAPVLEPLLASREIGFDILVATSGAPETFLPHNDIAGVAEPPVAIEAPPAAAPPLEAPRFDAPQLAARVDLPPAPVTEPVVVAPSPVLPPPVLPPPDPTPPSPALIAATPTPAAAAPVVAAVVVDDAAQVGAVLQKYRTAYERLDAGLVRAVWPGVNETALARAFEGLESQSLTFKACDVQLRGLTAAVVCTGSTRYVPKVGSHEPQVQPLAWNFTLRKNASEWKIESARAER